MRAVVRALHSPDVDLPTFAPEDPQDVGVFIQVFAGPADGPGSESFDLMVCTPAWLARQVKENGPLIGRHHVFVASWDSAEVESYLVKMFEAEEGLDWRELAERLGRVGRWEYEDYIE